MKPCVCDQRTRLSRVMDAKRRETFLLEFVPVAVARTRNRILSSAARAVTIPVAAYRALLPVRAEYCLDDALVEEVAGAVRVFLITGRRGLETEEKLAEFFAKTPLCFPVFFRLDHYSNKDSPFYREIGPVDDAATMARIMCTSLRTALSLALSPRVFVFDYEPRIKAGYEVRAFVRGRRLVAVSAYDCSRVSPRFDYAAAFAAIHAEVERAACIECADYVADFVVFPSAEARLLELNGFGATARTGPGLFTWDELDIEAAPAVPTFRLVGE